MTDKKPHVVVGVPTGTSHPYYQAANTIIMSMVELTPVAETTLSWAPGALIYNARNKILRDALKTGAQYIWWLDDDMILGKGVVTGMFDAIRHSNFAAISGLAPMRRLHTRLCVSWKHPENMLDEGNFPGVDRLQAEPVWPVNGFGGACVFMDLDRVSDALDNFYDGWNPEDEWQNPYLPLPLVNSDTGENIILGEDLAFCYRIRKGAGKLAVHYQAQPGHLILAPLYFDDYIHSREIQKRIDEAKKPKLILTK